MVFWGWMWGLPGVFLSVPLTILVRIVCEHVPELAPIAIFMGGSVRETTGDFAPIADEEVAAALVQSTAADPITPALGSGSSG